MIHTVLGDEVEVISAKDNCSVHLGRYNSTSENATTDGNFTSERALLVCE
jgi:hypothetical protein